MSQPASSDPPRALSGRAWVAPAPLGHPPHRSPARRWITAAFLTLAILLAPVTQLMARAEGTLLFTSGFVAALGTLPPDPAVQSQITAQLDRQLHRASRAHGTLASRLADITERQVVARAVPAIVSSPAFPRLWRTALNGAHSQLPLILRGRSHLLTITGSPLTVNVPVAGRTLINASGLPRPGPGADRRPPDRHSQQHPAARRPGRGPGRPRRRPPPATRAAQRLDPGRGPGNP